MSDICLQLNKKGYNYLLVDKFRKENGMGRGLSLIGLVMIALLFAGACATSKVQTEKEGEVVSDVFNLRPGGFHEECLELVTGKVMEYKFTSSDSVNFNIHYHAEEGIKYPVNEENIKGHNGTIDPESHGYFTGDQEFYCLMWNNPAYEPVQISFECTVKEKK